MKRPQVFAEVIERGQCRYFQKGQRFALGGFTPAGLCASAYAALARDAETMRYGGTLPWARDGKVLTRCPDPQGTLWQLRVEGESQTGQTGQYAQAESGEREGHQLQPCRGFQGACPFALLHDPLLSDHIDLAVRTSAWWPRLQRRNGKPLPHHLRLRVALAACPNACTMPQVRDLGVVATLMPQTIRPECNGCGACERTCRERAIVVQDGRAVFHKGRCVGCGQCIQSCSRQAIDAGPVRLRVLVGGRMGRHPRWAQDLCETAVTSAAKLVKVFFDYMAGEARPVETVANTVERITLERLVPEVAAAVRTAEGVPSGPSACTVSSCRKGLGSSAGIGRTRG